MGGFRRRRSCFSSWSGSCCRAWLQWQLLVALVLYSASDISAARLGSTGVTDSKAHAPSSVTWPGFAHPAGALATADSVSQQPFEGSLWQQRWSASSALADAVASGVSKFDDSAKPMQHTQQHSQYPGQLQVQPPAGQAYRQSSMRLVEPLAVSGKQPQDITLEQLTAAADSDSSPASGVLATVAPAGSHNSSDNVQNTQDVPIVAFHVKFSDLFPRPSRALQAAASWLMHSLSTAGSSNGNSRQLLDADQSRNFGRPPAPGPPSLQQFGTTNIRSRNSATLCDLGFGCRPRQVGRKLLLQQQSDSFLPQLWPNLLQPGADSTVQRMKQQRALQQSPVAGLQQWQQQNPGAGGMIDTLTGGEAITPSPPAVTISDLLGHDANTTPRRKLLRTDSRSLLDSVTAAQDGAQRRVDRQAAQSLDTWKTKATAAQAEAAKQLPSDTVHGDNSVRIRDLALEDNKSDSTSETNTGTSSTGGGRP